MFSFGFYNSKDGDRKYNASHFGKIFDGIIQDGVFGAAPTPLNGMFNVTPNATPDLTVIMAPGKAWLMHTWNVLDAPAAIQFNQAQPNYKRTDVIVIEVNSDYTDLTGSDPRTNAIKTIEGPTVLIDSEDTPPVLTQVWNTNNTERRIWQYPIAYVTIYGSDRDGGTTETQFTANQIKASNIKNRVNPDGAIDSEKYSTWIPLVTGSTMNTNILDYLPISEWQALFNQMMITDEASFNSWFEQISGHLSQDAATAIMDYIDNPSTGKLSYGESEPITLEPGQLYFQIEE